MTSSTDTRLVALLLDPPKELLDAFQRGFMQQLQRRRHYRPGWEASAEANGCRELLKAAIDLSQKDPR